MKKYILTNESITIGNTILYGIKAYRSFSNVKKGDLGGFIESEKNLDHDGNCWVFRNSWLSGTARVYWLSGTAQVYGNARVTMNKNNKIFNKEI